jgi:hypothetical protein
MLAVEGRPEDNPFIQKTKNDMIKLHRSIEYLNSVLTRFNI